MVSNSELPNASDSPWDINLTLGEVLEADTLKQFRGAIQLVKDIEALAAGIDYERTHENRAAILYRLEDRARDVLADADRQAATQTLQEHTVTTPESAATYRAETNEEADDTDTMSGVAGVSGDIGGGATAVTASSDDSG
jgi:hypothetical protein